jgi:hypothetical protein
MIDLKQVRDIINDHVRVAVGEIEEVEPVISFAFHEKEPGGKEYWKVNVSFTPRAGGAANTWRRTAGFRIDARTGEVVEFREGFSWTM